MSQKHLLLIAIGPVQDFIAASRSLRDLWFGSTCLSELSKTVARSLQDQGAELIFPAPQSANDLQPDSAFCVANKILAELPAELSPEVAATKAKAAWQAQWQVYAEGALKEAKHMLGSKIDDPMFALQLKDIGEFYAVWTSFGDQPYDQVHKEIEELLVARKSYRDFNAPTWTGTARKKSSLDGRRESVFTGKHKPYGGILKSGEELDALGVIKRFYPLGDKDCPHFDDLADIALIPWLEGIDKAGHWDQVRQWENLFPADDSLLWRKSRTAYRRGKAKLDLQIQSRCFFGDLGRDITPEEAEAYKVDELSEGRDKLFNNVKKTPSPYACILLGDGDHMGIALNKICGRGQSAHRDFSSQLARFAEQVETIIADHDGRLIYAGGDDVMAYVPLHTALAAAQDVRNAFAHCIRQCSALTEAQVSPPTFSIGLAILHHTESLSHAFGLARQAERIAKSEGGRDALAIVLDKRSGGTISIHGKWGDAATGIAAKLQKMATLHQQDELPTGLAYQLRVIANQCLETLAFERDDKGLTQPKNAASAMTLRLIRHKDNTHAEDRKLSLVDEVLPKEGKIRTLSDELIVARVFADAQETANVSNKESK
jgi:CRISPR-associated protein Cmr2